jgi:hypothetical protein
VLDTAESTDQGPIALPSPSNRGPLALARPGARSHPDRMFAVDEPTAEAIRRAFNESGELRRHFPLITDNEQARACVRTIASWKALLFRPPGARRAMTYAASIAFVMH